MSEDVQSVNVLPVCNWQSEVNRDCRLQTGSTLAFAEAAN
jgi:hypothetical protein